ncbi:unnamed protein product [Toxocara canis]|uniref:G protein-coupled receptor n=1 Tax=Toxocara canis TaxID=6265 RepID=A0A183UCI1_TOXCA|nr:unnamed protein product [Toxocara canis]
MDVNDAEKVTSRKAFTVVTILEMCLNFFNLLLVPYLFARLRRTKMIHTNLKAMLGFYNRQCWFNRFIYDTTMNLFAITMGAMACERIVATAAVRRYEQIESVTLSTTFVAAQILFVLYKINMREFKRRAMNTLAARYQLAENITTLRFLIPLVLLYGALYGITLIFVVCIANKMVNLPGTIYTTVYCCLCFVVHIPLRNKLKDDLRWISSNCIRQQYPEGVVGVHGGKLTFSDEGAIYFKALQNDWR